MKIQKDLLFFDVKNLRVESRANGEGVPDTKVIKGEAIVFNQRSLDLGGFKEVILPDSADKSLLDRNQKSYWNHNNDYVLGSVRAQTLSLKKTSTGIDFEIIPPNVQWARDFTESIARGDVDQMSFGFRALKDNWYIDHDTDEVIREVVIMDLREVSPVANPAYPQTSVSMRDRFGEDAGNLADLVDNESLTDDEKRNKVELMKMIESKLSDGVDSPGQNLRQSEQDEIKFKLGVL